MAAARVAMPSRSGSHITSRHQSPQPLGVRRPSPSSSSHATRSSSMAPTGLFRRRLLFLLNQESAPDFPFCEAAYEARSRIRWPPWPHRLDPGHRKVKEKKNTQPPSSCCLFIYAAGYHLSRATVNAFIGDSKQKLLKKIKTFFHFRNLKWGHIFKNRAVTECICRFAWIAIGRFLLYKDLFVRLHDVILYTRAVSMQIYKF